MARSPIVLESGPDGLRGKEFGPAADEDYWQELWDQTAVDYTRAEAGHLPRQLRMTVGRDVGPHARVLEAGCGLGHFTIAMQALGHDAVGIDWAGSTLVRLQDRFPAIEFSRQDVRDTTFADGTFDAVYSPGVCEHFEEGPDDVLAEAFRLLRPGGLAFVSTPYLNPLRQRRWRRGPLFTPADVFYQYVFPAETMCTTLRRLGFEVVDVRGYGVWAATAMEIPLLQRLPMAKVTGLADVAPTVANRLGSTCIWTARRPA